MTQAEQVVLRARGLIKTYRSTEPPTQVLGGIDLTVRTGEFLVVMGASGSGKSTLLHTISGMDRPSAGQVLLEGQEVTRLNDTALSRIRLTRMGFVFQQAYLLANLNLRDNILLPALKGAPGRTAGGSPTSEVVAARVDGLMERFGIAQLKTHGITQVSGGQLQRAAICRALAGEPAILFADEPTGALNSRTTTEVMDVLTQVHRDGMSIVLVTHDPACAARGDRVVYLRDGMLVDTLEQGRWDAGEADSRHQALLDWLRGHGF
ncbi:ABC transporter ATP-binding protein [Micropruina sp.]|uniref:ABC transporter ATP-binding protein n=1 Tax=Micropruina sp. TaxID=2737536 RepID=UPI0039E48526